MITLNLTISKALEIPPVNQCKVIAGFSGLDRGIESVNSFDAPDVMVWLKPKELVLTTGYLFQNNPERLEQLVLDLAERQCAGLAIRLEDIPISILAIANAANFPILKIPDQFSLSEIMFPLLKDLVNRKRKNLQAIDNKSTFIYRIIAGSLQDEEMVLAEKKTLGLENDGGYLCMLIRFSKSGSEELNLNRYKKVLNVLQPLSRKIEIDSLVEDVHDDLIIVFQAKSSLENTVFLHKAVQIGQQIISILTQQLPSSRITIGIGNVCERINKLTQTYNEALKSIELGTRLGLGKNLYCFNELEAFTILHYAPKNVLEDFVHNNLSPLLLYDAETNTDLVRTLEVYLHSSLRPAEAAKMLGIHRNTIHFRIKCIKKILENDLNQGECRFKLQLALYARRLLVNNNNPK